MEVGANSGEARGETLGGGGDGRPCQRDGLGDGAGEARGETLGGAAAHVSAMALGAARAKRVAGC